MIILMIVFYCFTNLFFKCLIVTQQVDFTPHDLVGTHSAKKKKKLIRRNASHGRNADTLCHSLL